MANDAMAYQRGLREAGNQNFNFWKICLGLRNAIKEFRSLMTELIDETNYRPSPKDEIWVSVTREYLKNVDSLLQRVGHDLEFEPWNWIPATQPPKYPCKVLVIQGANQWVREWDGEKWLDPRIEKYGEITHWTPLPPMPKPN